ncbi:MAG: YIP1 family protein [Pyrinomonadaceae bacterium]
MSDPNSKNFQAPPPPPFPAAETPSGPLMSTGQTLTGIFFEPSRVFESLRGRPRFLAAGIVMVVALLAFTTLFFQRVGFERMISEAIESAPNADQMTPEQKEQAIRMQINPVVKAIYYASPILVVALILAAGAGLYLLGSMLMGRTMRYKQALAVWAYSSMPPMLLAMLLNILLLFLKSPDDYDIVHASRRGLVQANLGLLVDSKASPVLGTFLSTFDLFAFYGLFLAALGLRIVAKMSSGTAWSIVLAIWVFGVIVRTALAAITGGAM